MRKRAGCYFAAAFLREVSEARGRFFSVEELPPASCRYFSFSVEA